MLNAVEYQCDHHHFPDMSKICCAKQFCVHEKLEIPCAKPDIEEIIEIEAYPVIDHYKIIHTPAGFKLVIEGHIKQRVLYVADVETQSVHSAHFVFPFCNFIKLGSHCSSGHHIECLQPRILIEYMSARKMSPREIAKCIILFVWLSKIPVPPPCPSHAHKHSHKQSDSNKPHSNHDYCNYCELLDNCPVVHARATSPAQDHKQD